MLVQVQVQHQNARVKDMQLLDSFLCQQRI